MLNTIEEIAQLLAGSFLAEQDIQRLTIHESEQDAFAIKVDRSRALEAWQLMRSHLEQTHRYPILSEGWGIDDFFSRFYYEEEKMTGILPRTSPGSIIASVSTVDLSAFLATKKTESIEDLEDSINYSLTTTKERFGSSPGESGVRKLIDSGVIQSQFDLEKWLWDWELQNYSDDDRILASDSRHLDWFEPDRPTLLLLPIENGWDSLAYLHWYGACAAGTPIAIGFLQKWYQKYNAELVCHYGTILQFNVGQGPLSPAEAFELAWEQAALAPCTILLPGVSLRDHARSLLTANRWFLHERP